jgi:hypothetical protein
MVVWFPCFWVCGEAEHQEGADVVEGLMEQGDLLHGSQKAKRERKDPQRRCIFQRHSINDLLPTTSPHLLIAH